MIRLLVQVQLIFLQWMPWLLRMSRPGEKITRKSIQMQKKLKELDKKEMKSKSLLANVLEMEDDFHPASLPHSVHPSNTNKPALSNLCLTRYIYSISIYALFLLFKLIIAIKALFFSCIVCSFLSIFPLFFLKEIFLYQTVFAFFLHIFYICFLSSASISVIVALFFLI